MSISDTRYRTVRPRNRARVSRVCPGATPDVPSGRRFVATVGNVADESVTSEGRCPR